MSLLAVQSLLARLYTDSAFRTRFFDDPGAACREFPLTAGEEQQLAGLDRGQVERFARSLRQKRLGLVRELLPGTAQLLGTQFAERFFEYCESQPSARERVEEARVFAAYLLTAALDHRPDETMLLVDLLRCEQLRLQVLYPPDPSARANAAIEMLIPTAEDLLDARPQLTPRAAVAAFQCDMEALYPHVLRGDVVEARPEPCFILIGKVRGAMRVRLKRVNAATARLLTLCDGTRPLAAIVEEVAAGLGLKVADRAAFTAECARFVGSLVESGLIRIPSTATE